MKEATIKIYGERGYRVRVYRIVTAIGTQIIRCEWRELRKKRRETWPDTKENERTAKGYAQGVAERLRTKKGGPKAPITLSELLYRWRLAKDNWRPDTLISHVNRIGKFITFAGENFPAGDVTPEMMDEFRAVLRSLPTKKTGKPMVANQIAACASDVKALLRFGALRGLLDVNRLAAYTVTLAKNEKRDETHEYTNAEWGLILDKMSPQKASQWRAYCLILLAGTVGPRQKALRHLQWADVDLKAREVEWRRDLDKMGKKRTQPLPRDAVRALRIAAVWRRRDRYDGPWIFYAPPQGTRAKNPGDKPYSYQSLNYWLHRSEKLADVPTIAFRAMHGYRRTAAGNVLALTGGDVKAAGDWIGDTDLKSLQKYLKKRNDRQREIAGMVSAPVPVPTVRPPKVKADG
jgi:integrase